MSNKTRKNKTNLSVVWPTTAFFTIEELHRLNPKFVNITLRVRLTNAIEDGTIAEIGSVPGGKGRPKKVFCLTPVTKLTLERAKQDNVILIDNAEKLVNIISVTATPTQTTPTTPVVTTSPVAVPA